MIRRQATAGIGWRIDMHHSHGNGHIALQFKSRRADGNRMPTDERSKDR
jgi:hypothetical protein